MVKIVRGRGQHPKSKAAFNKLMKMNKLTRPKHRASNPLAGIDPHRADARLRKF